ncbi:MAG: lytic transglycosylase domain-containing protein [Ignavibacterium sp.]|nr:lytic transglycosylase domain-containing protein [Ignavibacterium sp.]MDW8374183.1 lytic transglycosylase domain-containing protein [Ignavibacteriales bacterium]
MKNKSLISKLIYLIIGVILTITTFIIILGFRNENINQLSSNDKNFIEVRTPEIPSEVSLFGERIPLESFDIYERLEREIIVNTYLHSATLLGLKRSGRWFPMIEKILKENNIPEDFKYLAVAESNLDNVVSPAGATGFWQFMEATGKKYGLEINEQIDERYHVEKSTLAACNFLKEAYQKFGSWTLAAAAFNAGFNGIEKWSNIQQSKNFYNLLLNTETSRYIFRIAALKIIYENPSNYGYYIDDDEKYAPLKTKEIILDSTVSDFTEYSKSLGINYKILKYFNPWLRDTNLKNNNRIVYRIKVPVDNSMKIFND